MVYKLFMSDTQTNVFLGNSVLKVGTRNFALGEICVWEYKSYVLSQ